jgi:translation initiation factor IF-2
MYLAELLGISPVYVIKQLMRNGIMAGINQVINYNVASGIAAGIGYEPREGTKAALSPAPPDEEGRYNPSDDEAGVQQARPPVVTVMGHVDHGKTLLLDAIRETNVVATEAGNITQHIGACQVDVDGSKITFLDTPGHEAFTAMRARGAQVTDIVVLVVAADDGVMPQTIEAIDHCRAAGVPVVVAINKIDKPDVNPERVKQQLADHDILIEEWGGDVVCVAVSAKTKEGIRGLLESILVVAEMAELRADPECPAVGAVVEAELDKTRGPMATVLVRRGTLRTGDTAVVGACWGKIKAMFDDTSRRVRKAGPSIPVKILGLGGVPQSGDTLTIVPNEREAKILVREREEKQDSLRGRSNVVFGLASAKTGTEESRELKVVLKVDVQGSVEPIRNSLERLEVERTRVKVIHAGSGSITEGDVLLAIASEGIVVGFNTKPEAGARRLSELEGVEIRCYDVIYDLVDDVQRALQGMLEPTYVEVIEGHAEVRAIFSMSKGGRVAGVYVTDGRAGRNSLTRVTRNGQEVSRSSVSSLRRFKEDVKEVSTGFECGIGIEGYGDFEVGDIIEFYKMEGEEAGV